ncbi:Chitinase 2 [Marasmius tenuissimus]|uniref:chitinase n=1 Tax=Marasmius tenuissimus TaxID=585030 RepID=A0ABR2ZRR5_9AGAR
MCQDKGKIVTLSLGGDTANNPGPVTFSSDAQAEQFADTVWNLFLGGSSTSRPFGNAVLDGIDLDIEGPVPSTGYVAFVNRIRSHTDQANKKYYVTAAPQCPYPDQTLGSILNGARFDAVYVQFYNNPGCQASSGNINFNQWDQWAKTESRNKDVKIFLGVPGASPTAASPASYVDPDTLGELAKLIQDQYSSFGGVMLWDASQAYANGRYDVAIKSALTGATGGGGEGGGGGGGGSGGCSGTPAWSSSVPYNGGAQVTYNGHLWTAKWWTQAETPGSGSSVWTDDGVCFAGSFLGTSTAAEFTSAVSPESTAGPTVRPSSSVTEATSTLESSAVASASSSSVSDKSADNGQDGETRPKKASRFFRI